MEISLREDHSDAYVPLTENRRVGGLSGTVWFRYAAADVKQASSWTAVTIPERARTPVPSDFGITQPETGDGYGSVTFPDEYYEYSVDGGMTYAQVNPKKPVAEDLDPWKKVYVRRVAADGYAASEPLAVDILPFREEGMYSYSDEKLFLRTASTTFIINGMAVKSDAGGYADIDESWYGSRVEFYPAALADDLDRVSVCVNFAERPEAPSGITVTNESVRGKKDGSITGLDLNMEYSADGLQWSAVTTSMMNGDYEFQYGKTYYFRYAVYEGEDENFRSGSVACTISPGEPLCVTYMDGDTVVKTFCIDYGATVQVPAVPEKTEYDMNASAWDRDLTGVSVTENITVRAVYVKKGCSSSLNALFAVPVLLCAAILLRRRAGSKKEKRSRNG